MHVWLPSSPIDLNAGMSSFYFYAWLFRKVRMHRYVGLYMCSRHAHGWIERGGGGGGTVGQDPLGKSQAAISFLKNSGMDLPREAIGPIPWVQLLLEEYGPL